MNLPRYFLAIFASLILSTELLAQDVEDDAFLSGDKSQTAEEVTEDKSADSTSDESNADDEDALFLAGEEVQEIEAPIVETDALRAEQPDKWYFTLGARLRWLMIPEWMFFGADIKRGTHPEANDSNMPLINHLGVGPELTWRRNNLDITAAVWWTRLDWDGQISFKSKNDEGNSWEVLESDMSAVIISADFVWSKPFTDWFALTYGLGAGLGITIGSITRTEARQGTDVEEEGTVPCTGPEDADPWCNPGEEYGEKQRIAVIPWFNLLGGVRFKPHRNIAIYVDGGFGTGFFAGLRGGYVF